jgi:hypothetical protein
LAALLIIGLVPWNAQLREGVSELQAEVPKRDLESYELSASGPHQDARGEVVLLEEGTPFW